MISSVWMITKSWCCICFVNVQLEQVLSPPLSSPLLSSPLAEEEIQWSSLGGQDWVHSIIQFTLQSLPEYLLIHVEFNVIRGKLIQTKEKYGALVLHFPYIVRGQLLEFGVPNVFHMFHCVPTKFSMVIYYVHHLFFKFSIGCSQFVPNSTTFIPYPLPKVLML